MSTTTPPTAPPAMAPTLGLLPEPEGKFVADGISRVAVRTLAEYVLRK